MTKRYAKWYIILWRLIWIVPTTIFRVLYCSCVFFGWGLDAAKDQWESTS
jgi:hypothetical protein